MVLLTLHALPAGSLCPTCLARALGSGRSAPALLDQPVSDPTFLTSTPSRLPPHRRPLHGFCARPAQLSSCTDLTAGPLSLSTHPLTSPPLVPGNLDQADSSDSLMGPSGCPKRQRTQDPPLNPPSTTPTPPNTPAWAPRWLSHLLPHQTPHPVPGCVWGTPLASRPNLHTPWPSGAPASQGLRLPGGCCMPAAALQAARSSLVSPPCCSCGR